MANIGALVAQIKADSSSWQRGLNDAQSSLSRFAQTAEQKLSVAGVAIGSAIGTMAASAVKTAFNTAIDVGRNVMALGEHFIVTAASAEQLRVQLNVLTGSVEDGAKLFADLEQFAMATSFSFEAVTQQARTFLATGIKKNEVVDTLTLIGTLAMGDADRLRLLGKAYTDTMSKGNLRAAEVNQFAENNVNIMEALKISTGRSIEELVKMREEGKITFQDVHNALVGITTGQGQFAGLLDAMMQTTAGRWQAFQERLDKISREFGEKLLPYANRFLDWLDTATPRLENFADRGSTAVTKLIDKMLTLGETMDQKVLPSIGRLERAATRMLQNPILGAMFFGAGGAAINNLPALPGGGPMGGMAPKGPGIGNINPIPPGAAPAPFQAPDAAGAAIGLPMFNLFGELMNETQKLLDAANAVTVDPSYLDVEARKKQDRGASVLQRGSQEAFSAIINAMRGGKDPVVTATEHVAQVIQQELVPAVQVVAENQQAQGPQWVIEVVP